MPLLETRHSVNIPSSSHTFWLTDQLICLCLFLPPPQLHNEDDSSEASTSEQQPCTSATAQAGTSGQDQSQAEYGQAAAGEASGSSTQGEADAPPPPYASIASIDLGAAAAAPGMHDPIGLPNRSLNARFLSSSLIFTKCGCKPPKIATAAVLWRLVVPSKLMSQQRFP